MWAYEVKVVSFCSLIYVDRVLFNKISFMKTISVLVLLQRNVYVQRQKSTLFHFENTKMLTCCHNVFELRIQSKLESVFCRTLWKGFGNTQEDKMFLSLCNVECIYFWWFSKHGWNLLFRSHQWNRGMVLTDISFQNVWE